jgi:16S rRNA (guanine527-N7)-methyltransferase
LPGQDEHTLDRLSQFLDTLVHWNQRMDLTAGRTPDELVDLFLADAVVLAATTEMSTHGPQRWVDVGSGAGAPAIPLAVLRPDLDLTLVEPKAKRVAFLRTALGELSLERVQVRRARSSDLPDASFDVACSRATLKPDAWLREGARLADSIWVLLARGATPVLPGWRAAEAHDYEWPLTSAPRRALRFAKE